MGYAGVATKAPVEDRGFMAIKVTEEWNTGAGFAAIALANILMPVPPTGLVFI